VIYYDHGDDLYEKKRKRKRIREIKLSNFKQFEHVDLPGFSRITLLGGRNNTGKTSLLEAIFLFYDRVNPNMFFRHMGWRGLDAISPDAETSIAPVFRNYILEQKISLSVLDDTDREGLEITFNPSYVQKSIVINLPSNEDKNQLMKTDQTLSTSYAVDITYKKDGIKDTKVHLVVRLGPTSLNVQFEPESPEEYANLGIKLKRAIFIGARMKTDPNEDAVRFGQLDIEGKQELVLQFLKIIEPNLLGLSSIALPQKSLIYADVGLGRKIPIVYMGDGVSRLLSIILAIATTKNGIVLIDEVDCGIHYSVMTNVWEGITRAAREFNCQVIATTHSYECLQAAAEGTARAGLAEDFSYIRLDRIQKDKEVVAKIYSNDVLSAALGRGWEVR
jgi:AAA15 family ATPase/GTPase